MKSTLFANPRVPRRAGEYQGSRHGVARCGESNPLVRLEPCLCMVLCRWRTPHVWLGSIRPRSQCVGGMLPVQWCYKHVLELPKRTACRCWKTTSAARVESTFPHRPVVSRLCISDILGQFKNMYITPLYRQHASHTLASRAFGPQPHMRSSPTAQDHT